MLGGVTQSFAFLIIRDEVVVFVSLRSVVKKKEKKRKTVRVSAIMCYSRADKASVKGYYCDIYWSLFISRGSFVTDSSRAYRGLNERFKLAEFPLNGKLHSKQNLLLSVVDFSPKLWIFLLINVILLAKKKRKNKQTKNQKTHELITFWVSNICDYVSKKNFTVLLPNFSYLISGNFVFTVNQCCS